MPVAWLKDRPVAHRGYHDMNKTVFENTLSAFSRAVDAGFAIECDLHYASDGVPIVFHDDDLNRLCNLKGDVRERTSRELGLLSIGGTTDKIPSLFQLLDLVKGRVPLVIELKGRESDDEGFAEAVIEGLAGYSGDVGLMSFDHWLLRDLKGLDCPHPLGLTAESRKPADLALHEKALALGLDFISFHYRDLPNPAVTKAREDGLTVITWTVRDEEALRYSYEHADGITFEGFDPRLVTGS